MEKTLACFRRQKLDAFVERQMFYQLRYLVACVTEQERHTLADDAVILQHRKALKYEVVLIKNYINYTVHKICDVPFLQNGCEGHSGYLVKLSSLYFDCLTIR